MYICVINLFVINLFLFQKGDKVIRMGSSSYKLGNRSCHLLFLLVGVNKALCYTYTQHVFVIILEYILPPYGKSWIHPCHALHRVLYLKYVSVKIATYVIGSKQFHARRFNGTEWDNAILYFLFKNSRPIRQLQSKKMCKIVLNFY